eukprot:403370167
MGTTAAATTNRDQKWQEKKKQREQQQKSSFINAAQTTLGHSMSMPNMSQSVIIPQQQQNMQGININNQFQPAQSFVQTQIIPPQPMNQQNTQINSQQNFQQFQQIPTIQGNLNFQDNNNNNAGVINNPLKGTSGVEDLRKNMKEQYKKDITEQYQQRERSRSNKRDQYLQRVQSQQQFTNNNGFQNNQNNNVPPSRNNNTRFKYSHFNNGNNTGMMTPQQNQQNLSQLENPISYHDVQPTNNQNGQVNQQYFNNNEGNQNFYYPLAQLNNQNFDSPRQKTANPRPFTQSGDKESKQQYLQELQRQMQENKYKKAVNRQMQNQKDQYEDNFLGNFGKGGAGAPLKDQNGQAITTRKPHMNTQFERKPVKGILKKQDEKFDYFRSELQSRAGGGMPVQNNDFQPQQPMQMPIQQQQQYQPPQIMPQIEQPIPPNSQMITLPNHPREFQPDFFVKIEDPIKPEIQQIPPSTTQMPNMNPDQFNQFANQLVLYLHQERMARESEKSNKNTNYDSELDRIRNERLKLQQDYERKLQGREREYQELHEQNMKRINELWQNKLRDEQKRMDMMRTMKIAKLQEGEESILLTESFPNILEQELRVQIQDLSNDINQNTLLAQQKMNELQEASNHIEEERFEAEKQVEDLNDQMYKMKYDEAIRHKYVYQQLLSNQEDAKAKPKNYVPQLLPRRKNLDFIADIPNATDVNIPVKIHSTEQKLYYNTKVDPLYSTKPLGHDIYNTDIQKQKKELGTFDDKWLLQDQNLDSKLYNFDTKHLNSNLYQNQSGYVDSNRLPDRFGGFSTGKHMINYNTSNKAIDDDFDRLGLGSKKQKDGQLNSVSKFTYL